MKSKITAIILSAALVLSCAAILASAGVSKLGDVNDDNKITAEDARIILKVSAKLDALSEELTKRADVNLDGRITAADARLTLRVSAKLDSFPVADEEPTDEEPTDEEPTDEEPTTEPISEAPDEPETVPDSIKAFFSGTYYMEGMFENESEKSVLAVDGEDFEVLMTEGSCTLSYLSLSGSKYLKGIDAEGNKIYTLITDELIEFLETYDDTDTDFGTLLTNAVPTVITEPGEPVIEEIEGGYSYTYKFNDKTVVFTADSDGNVLTITTDGGETADSAAVTVLSSEIPGDMLSLDGYEPTGILQFAAALD